MKDCRPKIRWRAVVLAGILGVGSYVSFYFLIVDLHVPFRLPDFFPRGSEVLVNAKFVQINGDWEAFPDYHGLPNWFFTPIHHLDRNWLRPNKWEGHGSRTEELSFDWLLGGSCLGHRLKH